MPGSPPAPSSCRSWPAAPSPGCGRCSARRRGGAGDAQHAGRGAPGHHRRLRRPRRHRAATRSVRSAAAAIGTVAWVEDEALIDPVTAVSGGGPAYVFLLAELLERAAIEQGIPPDLARLLARQTVAGSGALLAASTEDAAALRRAVTSPKGTTERRPRGADGRDRPGRRWSPGPSPPPPPARANWPGDRPNPASRCATPLTDE